MYFLFKTYGCFLHVEIFKKDILKNNRVLNDILEISTLDYCDPVILTGVCSLVYNILENDSIEVSEELL